jgi:AcrR family transcriptional regulator
LNNIFRRLKQEIITTALKQFLEQGIRSMGMQKIAAVMGISTKTLYKHFADKEALLEACLMVHYGAMDSDISTLIGSEQNPVELIFTLYARSAALDFGANYRFYHDLNHYYPQLQDKVISRFFGHLEATMTGMLKAGMYDGYFIHGLQAQVVFKAIGVLYESVTRFDTYEKFRLNPDELIKHTLNIYLRGICTEKGLQVINKLII